MYFYLKKRKTQTDNVWDEVNFSFQFYLLPLGVALICLRMGRRPMGSEDTHSHPMPKARARGGVRMRRLCRTVVWTKAGTPERLLWVPAFSMALGRARRDRIHICVCGGGRSIGRNERCKDGDRPRAGGAHRAAGDEMIDITSPADGSHAHKQACLACFRFGFVILRPWRDW